MGRLETGASGAFCTGVLVSPDLVLTAAHCVAKYEGALSLQEAEFSFRPGTLRASPAFSADHVVLHPLYRRSLNYLQQLRFDVALVKLAEPVPDTVTLPLPYGVEAELGENLFIASWRAVAGGTPEQKSCDVISGMPGLVTLDCAVWGGESGSPVLRKSETGLEVVAVVSSRTDLADEPAAQASNIVIRLPALMQELARQMKVGGS
ncbi:MAG: trypsin-like peptidase domain-containing protein [Pseudomonadota bacterium]